MSIKYKLKGTSDFETIEHYTKDCGDLLNPLEQIAIHYETCLRKHAGKLDNSARGRWFEQCVYDAFKKLGLNPLLHCRDKEKNIEVDFTFTHIKPRLGVHTKTSLRERWKQADRDALACGDHNVRMRMYDGCCDDVQHMLLVHKEKADFSWQMQEKLCRKRLAESCGFEAILSVAVPEHLEQLRQWLCKP